tara:strand:- start:3591 stop:5411 length:1821 start_codon:yes stop_codon:yes gene_type:complete
MANKAEKIVAFHGGLNDNTDPKDIAPDELSSANDCSVSRVGRIGVLGGAGTVYSNLSGADIKPVKDYGLFYFSTDNDKDGKMKSEDWLALYNSDDGNMQFYYRDKMAASPSPNLSSTIKDTSFVESGKASTAEPSFYLADGILRYSNGDYESASNNRVHQYIDRQFFQEDSVAGHLTTTGTWLITNPTVTNLGSNTNLRVGDIAKGNGIPVNTTVTEILSSTSVVLSNVPTIAASGGAIIFYNSASVIRQGWVHSDQQLKSFTDLGITLGVDNSQDEGPDDASLTANLGRITLSYWTSSDGQWNGSFQYAASPIYHQGGVGPLREFGTSVNFYKNKVSFQLHISRTNSVSPTAHPFGDDRIIGTRILFRSHGADKWHKLKDFDLLSGGKFNWKAYDGASDKAKGIFDGNIGDITIANTSLSGYTLSCYYNNASSTINHAEDSSIVNGLKVTGDDIPSNTIITAILTLTSFSIAPKTTSDASSYGSPATLTFDAVSSSKQSFRETTATFTVTNNASGFTGRQGFLRLWGPHNEPIWKNINTDGSIIPLTTATHVLTITTPGEGTREFQAELLDESFAVVATSSKQKIVIADSGNSPPPTYSQQDGSS